jgi:Vacuolar import and degradation protein
MRSFFEGEIIDFKTHSLETENFCTGEEARGTGPGGVGTDARYWMGIGPFRELLDAERAKKRAEKAGRFGEMKVGWRMEVEVDDDNDDDDDDVVEDAMGGEDIIASHLRSRSWIENVLLKEWVLMRWKERCFINDAAKRTSDAASSSSARPRSGRGNAATPDPSSWGLTISGFYYVALRRQTGEIEGLYYDPGSLPFQILELRPEGGRIGVKRAWPAQQFR